MTNTQTRDLFSALRYNVNLGTAAYRTDKGIRHDTKDIGQVAWRSDTGKAIALVGPAQTVVQPAVTIQVFEHLIDNGYIKPDTLQAYAWKGGARTCIVAETGTAAEIIDGRGRPQQILQRVYDYDSFDGSASKRFGDASYVLICKNGMMGWRKGNEVRIRHTASLTERHKDAVQALRVQLDGFQAEAVKLQQLADTKLNDNGFRAILQEWFPLNEDGVRSGRSQNQAELVERIYHEGAGADAGTLWGAWQAHTNYVTHHRGRESSRTEQNLIGAGANSNNAVLADLYARAELAASM